MAVLTLFENFVEDLSKGVHDFSSDSLKVALSNAAPLAANTVLADITQIADGGGYVAGGYTLDGETLTETGGTATLMITDEVFTASGASIGPFRYIIVYNDTPASDPLIGWYDRGSSITVLDTENYTIDFDGVNGVLTVSATEKTVGELPEASALTGAEKLYLEQDGNSRQTSLLKALSSGSAQSGFRHKIINGGFQIPQRGTSIVVGAGAGAYTLDRWIILNLTDQPVTVTQEEHTPGQILVPGEPEYFLRMTFSTAPTSGNVYAIQKVENVRTLPSGKATTRFYFATSAASVYLNNYIAQNFGTGGSLGVAVTVEFETLNATSFIKRGSVFTVPSIAGKNILADNVLEFAIEMTPRHAATYDISRASLVQGDATEEVDPFPSREDGQELLLCQRRFQIIKGGISGSAITATQLALSYAPPVHFENIPAISATAAITVDRLGIGAVTQSSINIVHLFSDVDGEMHFYLQNFAGMVAGNYVAMLASGGDIWLDDEL